MMTARVARIFGFDVRIHVGWLVILGIIGYLAVDELSVVDPELSDTSLWLLAVIVAVGFFLSSLAHDLAHAVVARRRGVPTETVGMSLLVDPATAGDAVADRPGDELAIAIAGPLASIAIGVLAAVAAVAIDAIGGAPVDAAANALAVVAALDLIVGFVNLVPAYPLDGGRIIRAIGWRRGGSIDAGWLAASRAGRLTGFAAVVVGVAVIAGGPILDGTVILFVGWFLVLNARTISDRLRVQRLIGGLKVEDAMERSPVSVGPHLTVDTFGGQLLGDESEMSAVPVVSEGSVVGILGARQLQRLQRRLWPTTRVEDIMARPPRMIRLSVVDSLETAVERLYRSGLDGLPVVDGATLVGILTRRSVGKLVHERGLGRAVR